MAPIHVPPYPDHSSTHCNPHTSTTPAQDRAGPQQPPAQSFIEVFAQKNTKVTASASGITAGSPQRGRQQGGCPSCPSAVLEAAPLVPLLVAHAAHRLHEGLVGVPVVPVPVLALLKDVLAASVPRELVAHPPAGDRGGSQQCSGAAPAPLLQPLPWPCHPQAHTPPAMAVLVTLPQPPSITARARLQLQSPVGKCHRAGR